MSNMWRHKIICENAKSQISEEKGKAKSVFCHFQDFFISANFKIWQT